MHPKRFPRIAAFLSVAAALTSLSATVACSCGPPVPPAQALQQSAAVFLGKVVEVEVEALKPNQSTQTVTIDVERWWKGGEAVRVKVVSYINTSGSGPSGYGFQKGNRYLVYANSQPNQLWNVSQCSRTVNAQMPLAAADMKDLGDGTPPKAK